MTTEYTPTTAEVDEYFAIRRERAVEGWYAQENQDRARKEWDLMMAAHDGRVRAEALRDLAARARWIATWLRAEADRIEQEAGA